MSEPSERFQTHYQPPEGKELGFFANVQLSEWRQSVDWSIYQQEIVVTRETACKIHSFYYSYKRGDPEPRKVCIALYGQISWAIPPVGEEDKDELRIRIQVTEDFIKMLQREASGGKPDVPIYHNGTLWKFKLKTASTKTTRHTNPKTLSKVLTVFTAEA
jgi:hypothetical protein